ncbi:MAG: SRPBCC family protein [Pseudomonadota bacterium]
MSFTVNIDLGYEFEVKASAKEVFEVLSDVPTSAGFYPGVERLTDLGGGAYRWEMEKIGMGQVNLQTVYASQYISNKSKKTVVWTPVPGEGNTLVSGDWKITDKKKSTHVVLNVKAELTVALPALTKMVAAPVVVAEFERLTEQYLENLAERFGGEV